MIGQFPFTGHMPVVLALTLIFGFAIAAVSYALVESPCREALRRWERRHAPTPLDSSATDCDGARRRVLAPLRFVEHIARGRRWIYATNRAFRRAAR